jgi:hypothetical protein
MPDETLSPAEDTANPAEESAEAPLASEGAVRSDPVVSAMKMMGKTTAMATNGLESIARGFSRTLSFALQKSGLSEREPGGVEAREIHRRIDELCLEIGRRIFDLPDQNLVEAVKDPHILELVAGLQTCRERIQRLEEAAAAMGNEGEGTAGTGAVSPGNDAQTTPGGAQPPAGEATSPPAPQAASPPAPQAAPAPAAEAATPPPAAEAKPATPDTPAQNPTNPPPAKG